MGAGAGPSRRPHQCRHGNTRSDGYAPAPKLSVELRQVVVAQASTKLDGGSSAAGSVGYYGYENDVLNGRPAPDGADADDANRGEEDRARQEYVVVFKDSLPGADPHYYYGTHFFFQGHELPARRRTPSPRCT
jgi:hypothetical protein